jgi:hypothetical protein
MKEKSYIRIKRRIDLGKNYAGYYSMVGMSLLLCKTFGITNIYIYILTIPVLILLCWIVGYLHERFIMNDEQLGYTIKNPFNIEMMNLLKQIKHKQDEKAN